MKHIHTGIDKNTGTRYVLVYKQNPHDTQNALVVETDSLHAQYHDALMHAIDSKESMQSEVLADVLARKFFPNGVDMMTTLHNAGKLKSVSIDRILLTPDPNTRIYLKDFLSNDQVAEIYNPYKEKIEAGSKEDKKNIAIGIMKQVELLKDDIDRKVSEAKMYDKHTTEQYMKKLNLSPREYGNVKDVKTNYTTDMSPDDITDTIEKETQLTGKQTTIEIPDTIPADEAQRIIKEVAEKYKSKSSSNSKKTTTKNKSKK